MFVTSEGRTGARLQRTLAARNLTAAEQAAFEIAARELVELYAEKGGPKYEQAALEYLTRSMAEGNPSLADVAQIAAVLAERGLLMRGLWTRPPEGPLSVDPIVSYPAPAAARTVAHASPVPTYLAAPRWNLRCAPWKGGTRRHTPAAGGACGGLAIAARETRVPQCEFSRVAFPRRYARLAQVRRPAMSATPGLAR